MRWYLIVYQEMLRAFALIFMTTFRLFFSITMFGATRNLNCFYTNLSWTIEKKVRKFRFVRLYV